jgi:hypothetical protein
VAQKDHNAIPSPSYEQIEQKMLGLAENLPATWMQKTERQRKKLAASLGRLPNPVRY